MRHATAYCAGRCAGQGRGRHRRRHGRLYGSAAAGREWKGRSDLLGQIFNCVVQKPLGPQSVAPGGEGSGPFQQVFTAVQVVAGVALGHDAAGALGIAVTAEIQAEDFPALPNQIRQKEHILIPLALGIAQRVEQLSSVQFVPCHHIIGTGITAGKEFSPELRRRQRFFLTVRRGAVRQGLVVFISADVVEKD